MLLRLSTDICPKELTRGIRGYFNSLLGGGPGKSTILPVKARLRRTLAPRLFGFGAF